MTHTEPTFTLGAYVECRQCGDRSAQYQTWGMARAAMPLHRQHCSPHLTLRVVEGDPATTEMQV